MAYEIKPGQISVFRNKKKEKESHPDYNISCRTPDGVELRGALWMKESGKGVKYMSGKLEVPRENNQQGFEAKTKTYSQAPDLDDDIPF